MKRAASILALVLFAVAGFAAAALAHHKPGHETGHTPVTICHKPGTPAEHTIVVDDDAVDAHLAHGDYLGPCQGSTTTEPPPPTTTDEEPPPTTTHTETETFPTTTEESPPPPKTEPPADKPPKQDGEVRGTQARNLPRTGAPVWLAPLLVLIGSSLAYGGWKLRRR